MFICKLLGSLLLSAAGFCVGMFFIGKLRRRERFLTEFGVFLSLLETRLRFQNADIFTLCNDCAKPTLPALAVEPDGSPFSELWNSRIEALVRSYCLNNSDRELLSGFGSLLGTADVEGELRHIALYRSLLEEQLAQARAAVKQKTGVYRAIGLFGGVSAALMIL